MTFLRMPSAQARQIHRVNAITGDRPKLYRFSTFTQMKEYADWTNRRLRLFDHRNVRLEKTIVRCTDGRIWVDLK